MCPARVLGLSPTSLSASELFFFFLGNTVIHSVFVLGYSAVNIYKLTWIQEQFKVTVHPERCF